MIETKGSGFWQKMGTMTRNLGVKMRGSKLHHRKIGMPFLKNIIIICVSGLFHKFSFWVLTKKIILDPFSLEIKQFN